jgi:hypothetical protein
MSWTCPKCERVLKNPNAWHNCIKQDLDKLFENKIEILSFLFDKILDNVISWDNVSVSATKNCIVFVSTQTFLVVKPMKKELDLKFYLQTQNEEFPIYKSCEYSGKFEHHIRVSELEEVNSQLINFIKSSYKLLTTKNANK